MSTKKLLPKLTDFTGLENHFIDNDYEFFLLYRSSMIELDAVRKYVELQKWLNRLQTYETHEIPLNLSQVGDLVYLRENAFTSGMRIAAKVIFEKLREHYSKDGHSKK